MIFRLGTVGIAGEASGAVLVPDSTVNSARVLCTVCYEEKNIGKLQLVNYRGVSYSVQLRDGKSLRGVAKCC